MNPRSIRNGSSEERLEYLLDRISTVRAGQAAHAFQPALPRRYISDSQHEQPQSQRRLSAAQLPRLSSRARADAPPQGGWVQCRSQRCSTLHRTYRQAFAQHLIRTEVSWESVKTHSPMFLPTLCQDPAFSPRLHYLLVVPLFPSEYDALITQNGALQERLRPAIDFPASPKWWCLQCFGQGEERAYVQLKVRGSLQRCLTVLDFVFHLVNDVSEHEGPALTELREKRMARRLDDFLHGSLRHCASIDAFLAAELRGEVERRSTSLSPPPAHPSREVKRDSDEHSSPSLLSTATPPSLPPASPLATSPTAHAASTGCSLLLSQPLADSPFPPVDPSTSSNPSSFSSSSTPVTTPKADLVGCALLHRS